MIYKERDRAIRKAPARYVKRLIKQGVPLLVIGKHGVLGSPHKFYNVKAVFSGLPTYVGQLDFSILPMPAHNHTDDENEER